MHALGVVSPNFFVCGIGNSVDLLKIILLLILTFKMKNT